MLSNISSELTNSNVWRNTIHNLVEDTENILSAQQVLDKVYKKACVIVFKEVDKYLEIRNVSPKSRKLLKFSKPYWNDNLTVLLEEYM